MLRYQGRGYGAATIDAVVAYLRTKPDAEVLLTSCRAGPGSPQPFYLHYGFMQTGEVKWGEDRPPPRPASRRTGPAKEETDADHARPIDRSRGARSGAARDGADGLADDASSPTASRRASPIWFIWTDGEVLLYSRKTAPRNANIAADPRVSFNLDTRKDGDDVVSMEGTARFDPDGPLCSQYPAYRCQVPGQAR